MTGFNISRSKICIIVVLAAALAGAAYAEPNKGGGGRGGGGGGHGGGGGGGHSAGVARGGGGGGGGGHFAGVARGGGGGGHFAGVARGGGGAHFSGARVSGGRAAVSHVAARPSFHASRSAAIRGNRAVGRAATVNAPRGAAVNTRNAPVNAAVNPRAVSPRNAALRTSAVQHALNSPAMTSALHNSTALHSPTTRAAIAASAATAAWQQGHSGSGWWQHRHGGFGWVGPVFWPFAYYDIADYALWGYGYDPLFWDYGYGDIYAGLFAPYAYDDLLGYLPPSGVRSPGVTVGLAPSTRAAMPDQLAQMCGDDSRDLAGLPIEQIRQTIQLDDAQRAALDELADASAKAAQTIKAACPTQLSLTAPSRLAAMENRIEAMIAAVGMVQPPLLKLYDLLNDEQRARLNALGQENRQQANRQEGRRGRSARDTSNADDSLARNCDPAQTGIADWPTAEIDAKLHPNNEQRAGFTALQEASQRAAALLKASCQSTEAITPPARLEAIANRLDAMLQAVKTVRAALENLYASLSDEQKAQFEAIGPARDGLSDQPTGQTTRGRRHHAHGGGILRHIFSMIP